MSVFRLLFGIRAFLAMVIFVVPAGLCWAAVGGSISGTIADPAGAVLPGASLTLINLAQLTTYKAVSD